MAFAVSPLYPILDAGYLPTGAPARQDYLSQVVHALGTAGVTMLQYRNKQDDDALVLSDAAWLRKQAPPSLRILLNDRAHLVLPSGCDGVHVGQTDLSCEQARLIVGTDRLVGLSTHDEPQLRAGDAGTADYLAIGPVYATTSKQNAEPVVGLEGLRLARALTQKPLVAIGGISLERAAEVRPAGADAIAVISALFASKTSEAGLAKLAEDFLRVFR